MSGIKNKPTESIVSRDRAREMLANLREIPLHREWPPHKFSMSLRKTKGGGLVIVGYAHSTLLLRPKTFKRYVKPGYTGEQAIRAISRTYAEVYAAYRDIARRTEILESIDKIATNLQPREDFQQAIEAEEIRKGKASDYESMTYEEAVEWLAWLVKWRRHNKK